MPLPSDNGADVMSTAMLRGRSTASIVTALS